MGAMPEEIDNLKQTMLIKETRIIGKREYHVGSLNGHNIVLVFSRWGKVAASITSTTLVTYFNVNEIIFTGVAGAIDPALNVGDIVIADKLIQHDMDATPLYSRFTIPLLDLNYFPVPKEKQQELQKASEAFLANDLKQLAPQTKQEFNITQPKIVIGTIASADQFVSDNAKITDLASNIDNLKCVEMEGAAVAQACFEHNIPFSIVRIISDKANTDANIDFMTFMAKIASLFSSGIIKALFSRSK